MKIKITTFLFALIALLNSSWAQPVITGINGAPLGTKTLGYVIPGAITPGTAGANQTWDYSTIPYNATTYYFKSVDYATLSPTIKATFPTGNVASELYFGASLIFTQVFQLDASAFALLGNSSAPLAVPDTQLVFPHSYLQTHAGFTYDAYGTMITPFGTYSNTVRLREVSGSKFKYDYWQFTPEYKLIMEYLVDSVTQVVSGQTFYNNENPVSVNELTVNHDLAIYPNPVIDYINIQPSFTGNAIVKIYDIEGKILINQNTSVQINTPLKLDVSRFEKGLYFVKITNESTTYCNKFIVK